MRHYMNAYIQTVFVMLGNGCNLACGHCLRDRTADPGPERLGEVIAFLDDLAANQTRELQIYFFGGEPLLYTQAMRRIVAALALRPNVRYLLSTNGALLDAPTIAFCNRHAFTVSVSWDGPKSREIRGFDLLAEKQEELLALEKLRIASVVSAHNYPADILEQYRDFDQKYFARHGYNSLLHPINILNINVRDKSSLEIDDTRVRAELTDMAEECRKRLRGEAYDPYKVAYIDDYMNFARITYSECDFAPDFLLPYGKCRAGISVLSVDLAGNLYKCHTFDRKIGAIDDDYYSLLCRSLEHDLTDADREICRACPVLPLCNGGCPLIPREEKEATYCRLRRATYLPLLPLLAEIPATPEPPFAAKERAYAAFRLAPYVPHTHEEVRP